MKRLLAGCLTIASAVAVQLAMADVASADDTVVITSAPARTATEPSGGPNRYLLRSGLFTLGVAYVPALVVAIESDAPGDDNLYVPVAGPWLDLANREDCEGDCSGETVNKVLLVTSGVFQGLGALQILGAFFYPETRAVTVSKADGTPALSFRVMPSSVGRGSGLLAVGNF